MNGSKNVLTSKTYQGLIIMGLVGFLRWGLPHLGVDLPEGELTQVAEQILFIGGLIWAGIGRATARKKVTLGKGGSGFVALLLCIGLSAAGCAVKTVSERPAHEQARFYVEQLGQTYIGLHQGYLDVWPTLTPEQQAWAGQHLKPLLDKAHLTIDLAISAAKAWSLAVPQCEAAEASMASTRDGVIVSDSAQLAAMEASLARCGEAQVEYETLAREAVDILKAAQKLFNQLMQEG